MPNMTSPATLVSEGSVGPFRIVEGSGRRTARRRWWPSALLPPVASRRTLRVLGERVCFVIATRTDALAGLPFKGESARPGALTYSRRQSGRELHVQRGCFN